MSYLSESLVGYYRLLTTLPELRFDAGHIPFADRQFVIAGDELAELPITLELEEEPQLPLLWRRVGREYRFGSIRLNEDIIRDNASFMTVVRRQNIQIWQAHLVSMALRSVIRSHGSYSRFYTQQLCRAILAGAERPSPHSSHDLVDAARTHLSHTTTDTTMWSLARLLELLATLTTTLTRESIRLMFSML